MKISKSDKKIAKYLLKKMKSFTRPKDYSLRELVVMYFLSSYLYYVFNCNVISDSDYDAIAHRLYKNYKRLKVNRTIWERNLLNIDSLKAGSEFDRDRTSYPFIYQRIGKYISKKI